MKGMLKRGYYKITVKDNDWYGFRTIIGRLEEDQKSPKGAMFHIGWTYTKDGKYLNKDYLALNKGDMDEATFKKLPNREIGTKIYKNGKERYYLLYQ